MNCYKMELNGNPNGFNNNKGKEYLSIKNANNDYH